MLICLEGATGTGKSTLAKVIAKEFYCKVWHNREELQREKHLQEYSHAESLRAFMMFYEFYGRQNTILDRAYLTEMFFGANVRGYTVKTAAELFYQFMRMPDSILMVLVWSPFRDDEVRASRLEARPQLADDKRWLLERSFNEYLWDRTREMTVDHRNIIHLDAFLSQEENAGYACKMLRKHFPDVSQTGQLLLPFAM